MLHRVIAVLFLALAPFLAHAEGAPFGLPVGVATLKEARASLGAKTRLEDSGFNKWSNGPMLKSNGSGLGMDGLQSALFIFNAQEKLVGVILTLPKHRFESIKSYLQGKYKLVSAQTPFVGNQSATFREGPVTIQASAPHMSFEMEVSYIHSELQAAFNRGSQAEQAQKQKSESEKF